MRHVVVFLSLLLTGTAMAGCLGVTEDPSALDEPGGSPQTSDPSLVMITGLTLPEDEVTQNSQHPYRLSSFFTWKHTHLDILIIPPAHGSIATTHQGVLPYGPEGALPMGMYLDATLHVLDDWRYALDKYAEENTYGAWIADLTWDVRIIAEDLVTHEDIMKADVIKFYTETTYPILGAAVNAGIFTNQNGPGCLAYSTKWNTYGSLTYKDMYMLAGHELLHCFGMSHPDGMQPSYDIMSYESLPMPALRCPSNLNVLAAAAAFSGAFATGTGPGSGATVSVERADYKQYCSPDSDPRE